MLSVSRSKVQSQNLEAAHLDMCVGEGLSILMRMLSCWFL